jgi:hypothetical protein
VDGFVFNFAHQTNPEVLVLIEAQGQGDAASWKFLPARQAAAALWLSLDDEDVWVNPTPPDVSSGGANPYWNFPRSLP